MIKLEGFNEFEADLKRLSSAARQDVVMDALKAGARVIQSHAQENVRTKLNKSPTGFLVNAITVIKEGKLVLVGAFGVVYAKIHEFGGTIVPRKATALVFKIDGKWIVTKRVVIPARPCMRPAVDSNLPEIKQAITAALRGLLQRAI